MMTTTVSSKLPPLYHRFFPDFIESEIPAETIATCDDCVFCRQPQNPFINTKCCTYYPEMSNYLIGGLLQDPGWTEGKNRMHTLIKSRKGVTPYGLIRPKGYDLLDKELRSLHPADSGWTKMEVEALRCPFYDKGQCTVWAYREHCCSTHFCFSVGGKKGKQFWSLLNNYLILVEKELSKYALLQLGWDADKLLLEKPDCRNILIDNPLGEINDEQYAALWGAWAGREEQLYAACYEIISQLDLDTFERIMGVNHQIYLGKLTLSKTQFQVPDIPEFLRYNRKIEIETTKEGDIRYLSADAHVVVSPLIHKLVEKFDGTRTYRSLSSLFIPFGIDFQKDYLLMLYLNNILISQEA